VEDCQFKLQRYALPLLQNV